MYPMNTIEEELEKARIQALDEQERLAYLQKPITPDEFVIDLEFEGWADEDEDWELWKSVWEKTQ
jgi:predicted RecB family nuclease